VDGSGSGSGNGAAGALPTVHMAVDELHYAEDDAMILHWRARKRQKRQQQQQQQQQQPKKDLVHLQEAGASATANVVELNEPITAAGTFAAPSVASRDAAAAATLGVNAKIKAPMQQVHEYCDLERPPEDYLADIPLPYFDAETKEVLPADNMPVSASTTTTTTAAAAVAVAVAASMSKKKVGDEEGQGEVEEEVGVAVAVAGDRTSGVLVKNEPPSTDDPPHNGKGKDTSANTTTTVASTRSKRSSRHEPVVDVKMEEEEPQQGGAQSVDAGEEEEDHQAAITACFSPAAAAAASSQQLLTLFTSMQEAVRLGELALADCEFNFHPDRAQATLAHTSGASTRGSSSGGGDGGGGDGGPAASSASSSAALASSTRGGGGVAAAAVIESDVALINSIIHDHSSILPNGTISPSAVTRSSAGAENKKPISSYLSRNHRGQTCGSGGGGEGAAGMNSLATQGAITSTATISTGTAAATSSSSSSSSITAAAAVRGASTAEVATAAPYLALSRVHELEWGAFVDQFFDKLNVPGTMTRKKKKLVQEQLVAAADVRLGNPRGVSLLLSPLSQFEDRMLGVLDCATIYRAQRDPDQTQGGIAYSSSVQLPDTLRVAEEDAMERCRLQSAAAAADLRIRRLKSARKDTSRCVHEAQSALARAEALYTAASQEEEMERKRMCKELVLYGIVKLEPDAPPMSPIAQSPPGFNNGNPSQKGGKNTRAPTRNRAAHLVAAAAAASGSGAVGSSPSSAAGTAGGGTGMGASPSVIAMERAVSGDTAGTTSSFEDKTSSDSGGTSGSSSNHSSNGNGAGGSNKRKASSIASSSNTGTGTTGNTSSNSIAPTTTNPPKRRR